jgi:hypothetical protein
MHTLGYRASSPLATTLESSNYDRASLSDTNLHVTPIEPHLERPHCNKTAFICKELDGTLVLGVITVNLRDIRSRMEQYLSLQDNYRKEAPSLRQASIRVPHNKRHCDYSYFSMILHVTSLTCSIADISIDTFPLSSSSGNH